LIKRLLYLLIFISVYTYGQDRQEIEELQISIENRELFYEYLASKQLDSSYLETSNRLDLIDRLYKFAEQYKELIF